MTLTLNIYSEASKCRLMTRIIKKPYFGRFKTTIVFLALTLSVFLFWGTIWVNSNFGAVGCTEIMHVLMLPMDGLDKNMFSSGARAIFFCFVTGGILTFMALKAAQRSPRLWKICPQRILLFLLPVILLASITFADQKLEIRQYLMGEIEYSSFIDEHYQAPDLGAIVFPRDKKNLIIILIESMENTFTSNYTGEVLTPGLRTLQDENLFFNKQVQMYGSGWTIAGYTSYLFGLPLKLPLSIMHTNWNDYSRYGTFLPGAVSLLEVFEKNGYDIQLILGSDSDFGGRRHLFQTHAPGAKIFDKEYFLAGPHEESDLSSEWGFGDRFLFREAKDLIKQAAVQEKPFLAIIQTVDSHVGLDSFENDREYWQRTDSLSSDFARWLTEQDFYRDSVVLFVGDHLYMGKHCAKVEMPPIDEKRGIFNVFLNAKIPPENFSSQGRLFSSFDLAPTILEAIGAELPGGRFGLGISLFNDAPTLVERYGYEPMNEGLQKRSKLYDSFY